MINLITNFRLFVSQCLNVVKVCDENQFEKHFQWQNRILFTCLLVMVLVRGLEEGRLGGSRFEIVPLVCTSNFLAAPPTSYYLEAAACLEALLPLPPPLPRSEIFSKIAPPAAPVRTCTYNRPVCEVI